MPKLDNPICYTCKRFLDYDDPHPCFKHSKSLCVKKQDGKRGWAPSECEPCIGLVRKKLSAEGQIQKDVEKNWDILCEGVKAYAQRMSTIPVQFTLLLPYIRYISYEFFGRIQCHTFPCLAGSVH